MTTVEKTTFEGRPVYKVRLVKKAGDEDIEFYDAETGLKAGAISTRDSPMGPMQGTTAWSDYKKFGSLLQPATTKVSAMSTQMIMVDHQRRIRQGRPVGLRGASADQGAHQVTSSSDGSARLRSRSLRSSLTAPAAQIPAPAQAAKGIETFDAAWTIIRDSHFDPTMNGVDWPAVKAELGAARGARANRRRAARRHPRHAWPARACRISRSSHRAATTRLRRADGSQRRPGLRRSTRRLGTAGHARRCRRAVPPLPASGPAGGSCRSTTCRSPSSSRRLPDSMPDRLRSVEVWRMVGDAAARAARLAGVADVRRRPARHRRGGRAPRRSRPAGDSRQPADDVRARRDRGAPDAARRRPSA